MNKYLHVKNTRVVAITLEGETLTFGGQIHAVPYDDAAQVGDTYPADAVPESTVSDVNATKPADPEAQTLPAKRRTRAGVAE